MRIGLFGGSFNPIHHAHLIVATHVAEALKLDRVLLMPTAISPLKQKDALAPARDRWAMLKLAVRGNPLLEPSDAEIRRGGVSYTIDTLRALRRPARDRLFLILGSDAARLLPRWKQIDEVRRRARIVLVARPGQTVRLRMPKEYIVVEAPLLDISGTGIRDRIRKGRSIRYLVPDAVERYIRLKGLYR